MNSASRKLHARQARQARREARASAALGICGLILLAVIVGRMAYVAATVAPKWWRPVQDRPWRGEWPRCPASPCPCKNGTPSAPG